MPLAPLHFGPATQRLRSHAVSERTARVFLQDLEVLLVAAINTHEVPCAGHNVSVTFTGTGSGFQEEKRLYVNLAARENFAF